MHMGGSTPTTAFDELIQYFTQCKHIKHMHKGVWSKRNWQKDSYENLEKLYDISFDIFKEISGVIFSVPFILPNVTLYISSYQ